MPDNVFRFHGGTSILPHGTVVLQLRRPWTFIDQPVQIILSELDYQVFENRRIRPDSGTGSRVARQQTHREQIQADAAAERWDYIGKIEAAAVRGSGQSFYFEPEGLERGVASRADGTRQPVPFKLSIPVGPGSNDKETFTFWITGEAEPTYEVAVCIKDADGRLLAPTENTYMLIGVRGSLVMPRYLEIVQPYHDSSWTPTSRHSRTRSDGMGSNALADECAAHIQGRLGSTNIHSFLDGRRSYSRAEGSRQTWVRRVVEHMTGMPYKFGHLTTGGVASGGTAATNWRDRVVTTSEYPASNVCDQLGSMIQWIRGLPHDGHRNDYIRGGLIKHRDNYVRWANDQTLSAAGAVYYSSLSEAQANVNNWAKPGASIFYKKIEYQGGRWVEVQRRGQTDIKHESTIIRTRNRRGGREVQLFDYGGNIDGEGRLRGFVGPLAPVAQESGWMAATTVLDLLDKRALSALTERRDANGRLLRRARDARPASPSLFMGVGWRAPAESSGRNLSRPIGQASLALVRDGQLIRSFLHDSLHPASMAETIYPISHYIHALSGMPHPATVRATVEIVSRPILGPPNREPMNLLLIQTDEDGMVWLESQV